MVPEVQHLLTFIITPICKTRSGRNQYNFSEVGGYGPQRKWGEPSLYLGQPEKLQTWRPACCLIPHSVLQYVLHTPPGQYLE